MSNALFQLGWFQLHSGSHEDFKIDCDALSNEDLETLADQAQALLPKYSFVVGIPSGGMRFANALDSYATGKGSDPILLVDDVLTTGASMNSYRTLFGDQYVVEGLVIFARKSCIVPNWVTALFETSL